MNQASGNICSRVLKTNDEKPFKLINPEGKSNVILTCEHAGNIIPTALNNLGLSEQVLQYHIAYDVGIKNVACQLSELLDAVLILQPYSRLVVDCNRPFSAADCIPDYSDGIEITGNLSLSEDCKKQRYDEISQPFHEIIKNQIDAKLESGQTPTLISMHSFTTQLMVDGQPRPWDLGLLYNRDDSVAKGLQQILGNRYPQYKVALNEPYEISDQDDYTIPVHGEQRNIPHVMLEINNNTIGSLDGQNQWAAVLSKCINDWTKII